MRIGFLPKRCKWHYATLATSYANRLLHKQAVKVESKITGMTIET